MKVWGRLAVVAVALVGGDAAAIKAWWGSHPVWAAAGAVVWAAIVGAGSLLVKAVQKPADQRLEQFGSAADRALARKLSKYGDRYRRYMASKARFMNIAGLATPGLANPELNDVFVDVGLEHRLPDMAARSVVPLSRPDTDHRFSIWTRLGQPTPSVLVVLGAPGSGKTTLLRHVSGRLAGMEKQRRPLPVLLELRDHVGKIVSDSQISLAALIRSALPDSLGTEPPAWWQAQLKNGRCVVLLDGLDEVANATQRRALSQWIAAQIEAFHDCDYVITSRPHGYASTVAIPGAVVLETQPFTGEQVSKFLHAWYRADERVSTGQSGPDVDLLADEKADELVRLLGAHSGLNDLKANPLLLTMIANVHRHRGALPGSRAELYKELCEVMLWRRAEAKRMTSAISGVAKERVLAALAFHLMELGMRDSPREQVLDLFEVHLKRLDGHRSADGFLEDITANGLLIEREHGVVSFAHLTIQEYLASTQVPTAKFLAARVKDSWWRETTLLYIARGGDADQIVAACIEQETVDALSLAFESARGDTPLAATLRHRLTDLEEEAFDRRTSPSHRRLIAAVLADRYLRSGASRQESRLLPPVPAALYRLFTMDTNAPSPDGRVADSGFGDFPVTGVSAEGVAAFQEWFAYITNSHTLRIPTFDELDDSANTPANVWGVHPDGTVRLWTAPGETPADQVSTEQIIAAVADDVERWDLCNLILNIQAEADIEDIYRVLARRLADVGISTSYRPGTPIPPLPLRTVGGIALSPTADAPHRDSGSALTMKRAAKSGRDRTRPEKEFAAIVSRTRQPLQLIASAETSADIRRSAINELRSFVASSHGFPIPLQETHSRRAVDHVIDYRIADALTQVTSHESPVPGYLSHPGLWRLIVQSIESPRIRRPLVEVVADTERSRGSSSLRLARTLISEAFETRPTDRYSCTLPGEIFMPVRADSRNDGDVTNWIYQRYLTLMSDTAPIRAEEASGLRMASVAAALEVDKLKPPISQKSWRTLGNVVIGLTVRQERAKNPESLEHLILAHD